jgi:putative aldouronate transport system permease protein
MAFHIHDYFDERSIDMTGLNLRKAKETPIRRGNSLSKQKLRSNLGLLALAFPAIVYFAIWSYGPMAGLILAFKQYNVSKGLFHSEWVGLDNFKYFFQSQEALKITFHTIGYGTAFLVTNILMAMIFALLMYELSSGWLLKVYQTTFIMPRFLSWVVIGFISYIFLNPVIGVFNQFLDWLGFAQVDWYSESKYWPYILVFINNWKVIGLNSIMYYSFLVGIDQELYEAAKIDGASRWKQALHISIPCLVPLMIVLGILSLGQLFHGDFGLFYQIPRDSGALYPVTDIIDTYVFRGLRGGNFSMTTAVGLFQSVAAFILIVGTNYAIRRVNPERALF